MADCDATFSASFRFSRALFCCNLSVSSLSSVSFGMCFPLPTFKICSRTVGALAGSGG